MPLALEQVGAVDAGGGDAHEHLTGSGVGVSTSASTSASGPPNWGRVMAFIPPPYCVPSPAPTRAHHPM